MLTKEHDPTQLFFYSVRNNHLSQQININDLFPIILMEISC